MFANKHNVLTHKPMCVMRVIITMTNKPVAFVHVHVSTHRTCHSVFGYGISSYNYRQIQSPYLGDNHQQREI